MPLIEKYPSLFVVDLRISPDALFVRVTFAFGITAPVLSATIAVSDELTVCPATPIASNISSEQRTKAGLLCLNLYMDPPKSERGVGRATWSGISHRSCTVRALIEIHQR